VEFLRDNVLLIGLAIGSGIMLLLPTFNKSTGGAVSVRPNDAVTLMNRNNALVLDVREETEFATGHITGAKHIPLAQLSERLNELSKHKNNPIIVNCQHGMRSAKACSILRKADFTEVYNLQGGIAAWENAKLPLLKS
jgi:rhodanese-related sulfurtransferase